MSIQKIQQILRTEGVDGWLFCDFRGRDPLAYQVLGLPKEPIASRRWFYYVPAQGRAVRLVSAVESTRLSELPGEQRVYATFAELAKALKRVVSGQKILMHYSPKGAVPYVSFVDAGTIELVRSAGAKVLSAKDALQHIFALPDEAKALQAKAAKLVDRVRSEAFQLIGRGASGKGVHEIEVQEHILDSFKKLNLITAHHPIVGVNEHPADPHFELTKKNSKRIKAGDKVLIDLWAKLNRPGAVYFDSTWVGFVGKAPPQDYARAVTVVFSARDAAIEAVCKAYAAGRAICGFEVDAAARGVIKRAGYSRYFVHRTGHSISEELHSNGANMDGYETHDDRRVIPGSTFSIEPGVYIPGKFGIRSETNLFIDSRGEVSVVGELQRELICLLC
jgi:Xaa-Pro dipeptidase